MVYQTLRENVLDNRQITLISRRLNARVLFVKVIIQLIKGEEILCQRRLPQIAVIEDAHVRVENYADFFDAIVHERFIRVELQVVDEWHSDVRAIEVRVQEKEGNHELGHFCLNLGFRLASGRSLVTNLNLQGRLDVQIFKLSAADERFEFLGALIFINASSYVLILI